MEVAWRGAILVVLGLWFVASTIHQAPPSWWWRVAALDRLRLLPQFRFFAPRPGRTDYHLVIRDVVGGRPGPWREIQTGGSPPVVRWLLNPRRYRQKALTDLINTLLTTRRLIAERSLDQQSERLSLPYLALLAWATAQPGTSRPCLRQFAIVASAGHEAQRALRVVFLSNLHALEEDEADAA